MRRRRSDSKRFAPHKFNPMIQMLSEEPVVLIDKQGAYDPMFYIVDQSPDEVSWLGAVERNGMEFLIQEVFLFDQEVHSTQTTMDTEAVGAFFAELASQPDGVEKVNKIKLWGHSHVGMGVSPSGPDEDQMRLFGESADWFVMGIANKRGDLRFEIHLFDLGIKIVDVEWEIYEPEQTEMRKKIEKELTSKVRKIQPPVIQLGTTWYGGYNDGKGDRRYGRS